MTKPRLKLGQRVWILRSGYTGTYWQPAEVMIAPVANQEDVFIRRLTTGEYARVSLRSIVDETRYQAILAADRIKEEERQRREMERNAEPIYMTMESYRSTECWHCKESLTSESHATCSICGWLQCSSGYCSPQCHHPGHATS